LFIRFNQKTLKIVNFVKAANMKHVTLKVTDSKFKAFIEFVKTLDYVKIDSGENLADLEKGLKEVKQIQDGKLKSRPVQDLLNEL
jgi:hypothetical protein